MKKIDLGQAIGIFANVGVIAGIAFLAVEIAQNTNALQSQALRAVQTDYLSVFEFPDAYLEAVDKNELELTNGDLISMRSFLMRAMRIYENQWYQHSQGYLDEEFFRAYQQQLRITLANEDFAELWIARKQMGFFHPDFVAYVDSFLVENPPFVLDEVDFQ